MAKEESTLTIRAFNTFTDPALKEIVRAAEEEEEYGEIIQCIKRGYKGKKFRHSI